MQCEVFSYELRAARVFASKDPSRYIISGIHLEVKDGPPVITGTDGRALMTLKSEAAQTKPPEAGEMTITPESLNIIQKLFPRNALLRIEDKGTALNVFYNDIDLNLLRGVCEMAYPNYRMVIPRKNAKRTPLPSIGVNSYLIARFEAVAKMLGLKDGGIQLQFVDEHSVIVAKFSGAPYVWAGVMPMRIDSEIELFEPDFLELPALTVATHPEPATA